MKSQLRGRTLRVGLASGCEQAAKKLKDLGFTSERAIDVAEAATKYAEEETALLVRQLTPKSAWPGAVVIRRHLDIQREETWLMLKHEGDMGWTLDSALFA